MTDGGGDGISERELTCAICTEILYQPLALLDCLHTFCGACLKEWFKWQATSASSARRGTTNPYTCPSCRDSVRKTKADWRLNSLLEGFLKAHPDKVKSEQERKELADHYKPGDDVLPPVRATRGRHDADEERILAEVRDMSMADVDGRRRTVPTGSRQDSSQTSRLTESTLLAHDSDQPQIEHQPSLRSLLSASDENSQDVEAEILRSIYTEGLLDGIDLDNLTAEQEDELTEKIAEAYRRRHRLRERSQPREGQRRASRSPRSSTGTTVPSQSTPPARETVADGQQQQTRPRPPVSRPHLFGQALEDPSRTQRRSRSSASQRSGHSDAVGAAPAPATRSATDLSHSSDANSVQRERGSPAINVGRPTTEPQTEAERSENAQSHTVGSTSTPDTRPARPPASDLSTMESTPRPIMANRTTATSTTNPPEITPSVGLGVPQTIRPVLSHSAFAPEPVEEATDHESAPPLDCNRCGRRAIQYGLHYNCRWCLGGGFNLCLDCYRNGQGCDHWFGFGFRALERWHRTAPPQGWPIGFDRPHVFTARRWLKHHQQPSSLQNNPQQQQGDILEEGAFCESCFAFADDCYWHCSICQEGAWGFCDTCVKQGRHCTHPLIVVAHLNSVVGGHIDPAKLSFVAVPHLRQDTYVALPIETGCDVCHRSIEPHSDRLHCYKCNDGDYDVCNECYRGWLAHGQISQVNGPNGWRRCLAGHRLAVVGYQDTPEGGHLRLTVREAVGGWSLKEDSAVTSTAQIPPDGGVGMRCLALYAYFPKEGVHDELAFPKYAEIREVEDKNSDWYIGMYAGAVKLFPSNHVRIL